jgi:hypothetical protein
LSPSRSATWHKLAALLVQCVHGHGGRDRLQRVDEAAFKQIADALGVECARTDRLCRGRNAVNGGLYPHVEIEFDVDPDAVGGDQRLVTSSLDLHAVGPHVDLLDLVQEGQGQTPAGEHYFLAAESGADQGYVARRFSVKAVHERHDEGDGDDRTDDR